MKNYVKIVVEYDGYDNEYTIPIGEDLDKFVDDVLDKFDLTLRDIIAMGDFHVPFEKTDKGQKMVVDAHLDNLRDESE